MEKIGKIKDRLSLKALLDQGVETYNQRGFIAQDPISIPHQFTKKQDIEISGFLASMLAWGQRKTILSKTNQLLDWMGKDPHHFMLEHREKDLKPFVSFKHRTFNGTDILYAISFFRYFYLKNESLEDAFKPLPGELTIEKGLVRFHEAFCSLEHFPPRTKKHIPSPARNSACKRMVMFLRWMVRKDDRGVDFGLWSQIKPHQLVCPCDVHVERMGRKLGLIQRKQLDWKTASELTENLKSFDKNDPVKYDFALFGLGLQERKFLTSRTAL